jgi:hypothetical protein
MDNLVPVDKFLTKNKTSGIFSGSVCARWNADKNRWEQFGEEYRLGKDDTIPCKTDVTIHLSSEFAVIAGIVGCDNKASSSPAVNNKCMKCNGGELGDPFLTGIAPQGICDWRGIPCSMADSEQEVLQKCPHLKEPGSRADPSIWSCLDRCYVCGGFNKKFQVIGLVNETGICDHTGARCREQEKNGRAEQLFPTVCGVCDVKENNANRKAMAGVCDCFNGGTPNGGKVLDRCNECDGGNRSMDFCGRNPRIPADLVCHPEGPEGNENWNYSCTGCDGVPRADLPWTNLEKRAIKELGSSTCKEISSIVSDRVCSG